MIGKKAKVDITNDYGDTPLHDAASNGYLDIVKALLEQTEVNVDVKNNYGNTPLHWAARNGHSEVVAYSISKRAKVDIINDYGETSLHWAAFKGHKDVVTTLLTKGADINAKDNNGQTPLHLAAKYGHKDVVTTLLEKGANPFIKNKDGKTPRDLANDENIIQLLKDAETKQIISKAIKTGVTLGIITALTVGIGCGIAGVELSILAIAVATALVIGVIAGGITYSVLRPSDKLDKPDLEVTNQQVSGKAC